MGCLALPSVEVLTMVIAGLWLPFPSSASARVRLSALTAILVCTMVENELLRGVTGWL